MVNGLGICDPQAIFLHDNISIRVQFLPTPRKEAYPKRPIPASYVSIFLQNALLEDTHPFVLPVPLVSCHRMGEMASFNTRRVQRYRISMMGSLDLGCP